MLEFLKKSPDLRALLPAEALHTREVAATVTDIKYREDIDSGAHLAVKDAKGLYAKARRGELKNFTGIDSTHEPPLAPDVHLQTANCKCRRRDLGKSDDTFFGREGGGSQT